VEIECRPSKGHRTIITIFCDGDPWRDVHLSIFGRRPQLPKNSATLTELSEFFFSLEFRQSRLFALRRLAAQSLPSSGLARLLRQRLVSEQTIERLIEELRQLGYLNDQDWTDSYVRRQMERRVGPRLIAQKLKEKGIAKMQHSLAKAHDEENQKKAIHNLLNTRYRSRNLTNFKEKRKLIAALMRRGFDLPVILEYLGAPAEFE
jgi:regulatory protein